MCLYAVNELNFISNLLLLDSDPESLMQALEELDYLAALDNDGNLSEMGIIMSELPLEPQMAKTVLASCEFDCVSEVVIVAAMLAGLPPVAQSRIYTGTVSSIALICGFF